MRTWGKRAAIGLVVVLVAMQLVPVGVTNPPVESDIPTSPEVKTVLQEALGHGGTSFDALYVNVNGESGYFDRSLHVYGREGEPCDRCATPIRRIAFTNRSSFFCPRCQPAPRKPRGRRPGAVAPRV